MLKDNLPELMKPELIHLEDRFFYRSNLEVQDEISLAYACMKLENHIKQKDALIPVYASDCYAGEFSINVKNLEQTHLLFLVHPETFPDSEQITMIPAGTYLHLYSSGSFWERTAVQKQFLDYAQKNGLCLNDKAIVISKIDYSITDVSSELLYEFQVRVLK